MGTIQGPLGFNICTDIIYTLCVCMCIGLCQWLSGKEPTCSSEATGLIPELGRSPGEGHGNPLQYFCLENSMDRGAWQATVHGVAKSQTQLKQLGECTHICHSGRQGSSTSAMQPLALINGIAFRNQWSSLMCIFISFIKNDPQSTQCSKILWHLSTKWETITVQVSKDC